MSVFIKGMEKPTDCDYCDFYRWGYCHLKHARVECEDGVDDDCPLVSVTEPHGRLIDADKLKPSHYEEIYADDEYVYRYYSEDDIGTAPTVIEAEGE